MRRGLTITIDPEGMFVRVRIKRLDFLEHDELCPHWPSALHLVASKLKEALHDYNKGAEG